jgi:hypothetical protein
MGTVTGTVNWWLKLAVAVPDELLTVQVPEEFVQAPLHPAKLLPESGVAVSTTEPTVRLLNVPVQVEGQLIPPGLLEIVPDPEPEVATVTE